MRHAATSPMLRPPPTPIPLFVVVDHSMVILGISRERRSNSVLPATPTPFLAEPRNMGYMVRLGLWGEGNPAFKDFPRFLEVVQVGQCWCRALVVAGHPSWRGPLVTGACRGRAVSASATTTYVHPAAASHAAYARAIRFVLPPAGPPAGQGGVCRQWRQHGGSGAGGDGHEGAGHVCLPHAELCW